MMKDIVISDAAWTQDIPENMSSVSTQTLHVRTTSWHWIGLSILFMVSTCAHPPDCLQATSFQEELANFLKHKKLRRNMLQSDAISSLSLFLFRSSRVNINGGTTRWKNGFTPAHSPKSGEKKGFTKSTYTQIPMQKETQFDRWGLGL